MNNESSPLEVLLVCFDGRKRAAKVRRSIDKRIEGSGAGILDQGVLQINAKGKGQISDPRRVVAGTLTPALTWGVFGFIAGGGWSGLVIWAVIGAVCGGSYAYYREHLATKEELERIASRLSPDSSALVSFVHGAGGAKSLISATEEFKPTAASVASIGADLRAQVTGGTENSVRLPSAKPDAESPNRATLVNMLIFRYQGAETAKQVNTDAATVAKSDGAAIETELLLRADKGGGAFHVADPKQGVGFTSHSSLISWGLFGVVYGGIVGFAGNGGVLFGFTKGAVVTGVAWGLFGAAAGALYGLWAGRGISARRLKGFRPLLPPDTSMVVAWVEGTVAEQSIAPWSAPASEHLILKFNPIHGGVVLEV
jgi:uncharacterized membrane protein